MFAAASTSTVEFARAPRARRTLSRNVAVACVDAPSDAPTLSRRRRDLVAGAAFALVACPAFARDLAFAAQDSGDWSSPGLASTGPPAQYVKTTSGLVYELLASGAGEPARAGDVAVFDYVMRRANGYFIYATIDCGVGCGNGDPAEYALGPQGNLIAGLDELLTGMKPGERRRALIKPELGYRANPKSLDPQPPEFGQRRQIEVHSAEPMIFEVKLVKTRRR